MLLGSTEKREETSQETKKPSGGERRNCHHGFVSACVRFVLIVDFCYWPVLGVPELVALEKVSLGPSSQGENVAS